ncbi:TATA box-binding protein-like 1 [Liolophura sinensis]|uniref:TATA box-binding protein-like 1 n=1 Tax=Liolophura sinensis TaxID=3198878 RepID=UPI00315836C8
MATVSASADKNAVYILTSSELSGADVEVGQSDCVIDVNQEHQQQQQEDVGQVAVVSEANFIEQNSGIGHPANATEPADVENNGDGEEPVIDIVINNVVSSFNTRCHLNLKRIAMEGVNVEYKRQNGMLNMKIRRPYTTASIWSSGKITCTGATSEDEAKIAARRFARILQRLGFNVKFCNFRVVNVLATCTLPFGIKITNFSRDNPQNASYEPELHPGVTYKIKSPKATLKIFSTGSITVTAPCVANVQVAIEHIFPLVYEYKSMELHNKTAANANFIKKRPGDCNMPIENLDTYYDGDSDSEGSFDSDESQD